MKVTPIFYKTLDALEKSKIVVSVGGSGAGKTVSAMQILLMIADAKEGLSIALFAQTVKKLKNTLIEDFKRYVMPANVFNKFFNKTDSVLELPNGSKLLFLSADDASKFVGTRFDFALFDEVNTYRYGKEIFKQVFGRLRKKAILCYNPSSSFWITDYWDRAEIVHSTYKDNPYLPKETLENLMLLAENDENFRRVYIEGIEGVYEGLVYKYKENWTYYKEEPEQFDAEYFGLDFGYVHPAALVRIRVVGKELYVKLLMYSKGKLIKEIADIIQENNIRELVADSEDARGIADLRRNYTSFRTLAVKKGQNSIIAGIRKVKEYDLRICEKDKELIKELNSYKYAEDKDGNLSEKPEKKFDDALDAIRYIVLTYLF